MSESGQSWRREFKAHPAEAREVRRWVGARLEHLDAQQVAHELFIVILATGAETVEMTLSTAGERIRISSAGSVGLALRHSHGPGFRIINSLSASPARTPTGMGSGHC